MISFAVTACGPTATFANRRILTNLLTQSAIWGWMPCCRTNRPVCLSASDRSRILSAGTSPDRDMTRKLSSHLVIGLFATFLIPGHGEGSSRWRIYRTMDGLGEAFTIAVTTSPRGNVWAKHGASGLVSWLDGFQIRTIPFSENGNIRIYESRSGQLWSSYSDGVMEFRRDQWLQYPIAEVRAANQASPMRLVRPTPLLPVERDHVLVLLSDRLLEYDAAQNKTIPLRWATNTVVGRFIDLVEARDGGAWLSGSNGLAKLPAPIRRLTSDSTWEQIPVAAGLPVHNLEH